MEDAIAKVRELPADRQVYAAALMEIFVAQGEGVYRLTEEERREMQDGLAEIERGEIATDDEMKEVWTHAGL